ncbi:MULTISPECIES: hypothetical protein [unclassified Carboxylicivirga]|uniref:hypothetical protein n=1 Tax=Carboxylicivirga TaxID=1628153 RepID=UPI003D3373C7
MYNGLLHLHSGLRYIILALFLVTLIMSLNNWLKERKYTHKHHSIVKLHAIVFTIQFVAGVALYAISSKVLFDAGMMKSTLLRFFTLEHPLMMLIATILIVHSAAKAKIYSNYTTHKRLFWYNLLGLLLVVASIPWPFREQLGAGWF